MPNQEPFSSFINNEAHFRHNICVESLFSAFNGIFLGMIMFTAPVAAVVSLDAGPLALTVLVSAFPIGTFLGPLWAHVGQRWGMQKLVLIMMLTGSLSLLAVFWAETSMLFTALVALALLTVSAMRMGQASLYRLNYPPDQRGRVLGRLTFCTYATMVPTMLLAGWLLDQDRGVYRFLFPAAGLCGILGCFFYSAIKVPTGGLRSRKRAGILGGVRTAERILRQDRAYRLFQIAFFMTGGSFFLSRHVLLLLTRETFGFSAFELSLCFSVIPQFLLASGSPLWGRILDRIGILRCRVLISAMLSAALACYFTGLYLQLAFLIYVGSVLNGFSNGGGQLTWFLASALFAPRTEDVPAYNGIHFVLNGIRGLTLPSVGSVLLLASGSGAVLAATLFSLGSTPVLLRALRLKDKRFAGYDARGAIATEPAESATHSAPASPNAASVPVTSG